LGLIFSSDFCFRDDPNISDRDADAASVLYDGYNYDSTSIRRPFDCLSKVTKVTIVQHNTPLAADPLAAFMLTYLFI